MVIRHAQERDAPAMGRVLVETWLAAHKGQISAAQWRGIGRRLLATAVDHLRSFGHNALVIGCLAANKPARGFYEALGGTVVGEALDEEYGYQNTVSVYGWVDSQTLGVAGQKGAGG